MTVRRLSLKARALTWLAQREHSRAELRRKLMRVAQAAERARPAPKADDDKAGQHGVGEHEAGEDQTPKPDRAGWVAAKPQGANVATNDCSDPAPCVEALLDWLQTHGYLCESRFVESRVHARLGRYGNLRIRRELEQHGVELDAQTLQQLRDSEFERVREVWRRKFGEAPADASARARQLRFLAQRGFSADVVRRVVQGGEDDKGDAE